MTQKMSADPKREEGRGTKDEKNGRTRFLPSHNDSEWRLANGERRMASSEWRIASGEIANGEWRMVKGWQNDEGSVGA